MRYLLLFIFSGLFIAQLSANDIAEINKLKKEATEAFNNENYEVAIEKFILLKDSFNVKEETLLLNLAHSYWNSGDTTQAQSSYSNLLDAKDKEIRSIAYQQTGSIAFHKKNYDSAIAMYKQSLLANPYNEQARYDFELAMKKKKEEEEKKKQEQQKDQQKNKDEQNKDEKNEDQKNKDQKNDQNKNKSGEEKEDKSKQEEQEKADEEKADQKKKQENDGKAEKDKEDKEQNDETDKEKQEKMKKLREKLQEMNMSEEKAQMILEALQNNEVQYLKQMQRKSTKQKDSDKPDW
ncbi:tetratricopeptide repeat protein [Marinigracilibium pacificum]|uniref:Tetratricopeptide repeat protein n=1 Tax=Marinigracilibium pacificum TaxID=2729599 RepID=A0A848IV51_9BACT|nr:hypothetical protein [Marinigracilibium pacificum]NMM48373.1 hypothetical protein [Marinigracilibium pacificum]